jgi:hypothetical protein
MTIHWANKIDVEPSGSPRWLLQAAYTCDNCRHLSVAQLDYQTGYSIDRGNADGFFDELPDESVWYPKAGESPQIVDVPNAVRLAAEEAYLCASVGANLAAILMARTTIEATAKAKNITSGRLVQKIDALRDENLIRPDIALAAHEIRYVGNEMAHGDLEDLPGREDADDVLSLMSQVLAEVFQGPALLHRVQERRSRNSRLPG